MPKKEIICEGSNDVRKTRIIKTTYYMDWFDETAQVVFANIVAEIVYKLQIKIFGIWITIKQYKSRDEKDDEYLCRCAVCDFNRLFD